MSIPRSFIDDLLTRVDIVEVIKRYVTLEKRGKNYLACCPFHAEKSPSFSVNPHKQFFYCFGCHVGGNALTFVMQYEKHSFVDAVEALAASIGLTVPNDSKRTFNKANDYYKLLHDVSAFYQKSLRDHPKGKEAIEYLKSRGLTGEIAKKFQLGYAPPGWHNLMDQFKDQPGLIATGMLSTKDNVKYYDRFRHHIMYPILKRGNVIGFGARVLEKGALPKYINSPETVLFQKSRELYGLDQVLKSKHNLDHIIIVEGYMM